MAMLQALQDGNLDRAEKIRSLFQPLENLRDSISPVRVLHAATQLAGIATTGPLVPPLSPVASRHESSIETAAKSLLDLGQPEF